MEILGKVIAVLPVQSGTSKSGNEWAIQTFVVETEEQYPKKTAIEIFGREKIDKFAIKEGERVSVGINIDAREYNGRWFNEVRAWKVDRTPATGAPAVKAEPAPAKEEEPVNIDELPF